VVVLLIASMPLAALELVLAWLALLRSYPT